MSNYKPRIESNDLDLTSILSTINELPDAGSGGGGAAVETCRLHVGSDGTSMNVIYTGLINGVPHSYFRHDTISDIDTDNCICGSVVICITDSACTYSVENASIVDRNFLYGTLLPEGHYALGGYCYAFRIDAPSGGLVTIYLEEDL